MKHYFKLKQFGHPFSFVAILLFACLYPRYRLWSFLGILALYIVYSLSIAAYNVLWHPLCAYPGPLLRAAFYFPEAYATLDGTCYSETKSLHDKYGSVVRIAPDVLSYNNAQAWKDIYGLRPDRTELGKNLSYYRRAPTVHILNANQQEHHRLRKLLAPGFSDKALIEQEPLLNTYFDLLISKLDGQVKGKAQGRVDLVAYYNFITFDIVGDLVLGEPFGALEAEQYHQWIRNVFESVKFLGVIRFATHYPMVGLLLIFARFVFPSIGAKRYMHLAFTREKIEARLKRQTDRKDIMASILRYDSKSDNVPLTEKEIKANSRILLAAGSETTATTLSGITWLLLTNPAVLQRVQSEVRSAFKNPEEMTLRSVSEVERLRYLNAVIQESMRLYPSVPSTLPRMTGSSGTLIDGRFVPGNISVGVHQWSTYHSKDNFALPEEFHPERWLASERPAMFENDNRDAFQPFTTGPRACLGKTLAYFEIRSVMARILWHFDMHLKTESQDWMKQKEYTFWDKSPLWVTLKRRARD